MTSARLRKTFKYPSDDEDSGFASRDEMDEEEQENVISSLQSRSKTSNQVYTVVFSLMPLALTPLFTYYFIFSSSTPARLRLLSLLALTSLLASSFTMFFMSSVSSLDARERLDRRQKQMHRNTITSPSSTTLNSITITMTKIMDRLDDVRLDLDADGPLLKMLPVLNVVMCGLLVFAGWILQGQTLKGVPEYMWMYFMLPGVMAGMTTIARKSIMDEETELKELKGLKYGYKGA